MLIAVSLYLWGDRLDPNRITELIRVEPSDARTKGQMETTSTNKVVTAKTGVWSFSTDSELNSLVLGEHIELLRSRFGSSWAKIINLPGVQDACVDVFMAIDPDKDNTNTCYFELTPNNLSDLQASGLRMQFSVALIEKAEESPKGGRKAAARSKKTGAKTKQRRRGR